MEKTHIMGWNKGFNSVQHILKRTSRFFVRIMSNLMSAPVYGKTC